MGKPLLKHFYDVFLPETSETVTRTDDWADAIERAAKYGAEGKRAVVYETKMLLDTDELTHHGEWLKEVPLPRLSPS